MSAGQIIGGVVGGVIGFFLGGPIGAAAGVGIGAGIGGYIDPPKIQGAGKPQISELNITTAKEGDVVPELLGISKITGNIIQYWGNRTEEVKQEQESGKGGNSSTVIAGYKHYLSWLQMISLGETDFLYAVYKAENVVWFGELERPVSGGMSTITLTDYSDDEGNGTILGNMIFYFGTDDQAQNSSFLDGIPDSTLNVPYRNFCYAFFDDFLLGNANRVPIFSFIVGKRPTISFNAIETINIYDYNPAHAIWWILENMTDLPTSFLDETSFNEVANTLVSEGFGISILFDTPVSANDYIDNILLHIAGIKYYDTDGKLKLKLIRQDEDEDNMLSISDNDLIEKPSIKRGSWVETVNEIHGIYPLRIFKGVEPTSNSGFLFGSTYGSIGSLNSYLFSAYFDGETLSNPNSIILPATTGLSGLLNYQDQLIVLIDADTDSRFYFYNNQLVNTQIIDPQTIAGDIRGADKLLNGETNKVYATDDRGGVIGFTNLIKSGGGPEVYPGNPTKHDSEYLDGHVYIVEWQTPSPKATKIKTLDFSIIYRVDQSFAQSIHAFDGTMYCSRSNLLNQAMGAFDPDDNFNHLWSGLNYSETGASGDAIDCGGYVIGRLKGHLLKLDKDTGDTLQDITSDVPQKLHKINEQFFMGWSGRTMYVFNVEDMSLVDSISTGINDDGYSAAVIT